MSGSLTVEGRAAVAQRLCEMQTPDSFLPVEVRQRARDFQDAVVTARGQAQRFGRALQEFQARPVGFGDLLDQPRTGLGVGAGGEPSLR